MNELTTSTTAFEDSSATQKEMDLSEDSEVRLESLMALAQENQNELRLQLTLLFQEHETLQREVQSLQGDDLFQIDTAPNEGNSNESVQYESAVDSGIILGNSLVDDSDATPKKAEENVIKNSCFNCGGDHQLPDCTEPRDQRRINQNRREFLANNVRSARYHIDENQKFGQLLPGLPSAALRKALGLDEDQIPSYIYRMREQGLPPGWLKAAEISHSGLAVYVEKDQSVPEAVEEEGEISDSVDKMQYDFDRLPEWPGFNVEMPQNVRDESRKYNVPQMKTEQLKSSFVAKLKEKAQRGYVRREMTPTSGGSAKKRKLELDSTVSGGENEDTDSNDTKNSFDDVASNPGNISGTATPLRGECEVIHVDTGTPIVTLHSSYSNLPDQSKWTTNTTDHILFENLPESTGKYENIRGILQKVRESKKLNFDEVQD